jgi:hypothetical protein
MTASAGLNLGFLTVLHETNGYVGGFLVTNVWGRPLEFRLSTAVQPNRVQQILYGSTLLPYVYAEVIGKALVDKTATAVQAILTDREPVLELRPAVATPVVWLARSGPSDQGGGETRRNGEISSRPQLPAHESSGPPSNRHVTMSASGPATELQTDLVCHPLFPEDARTVQGILDVIHGHLDLAEPFARVRDAIAEAHKMGVTARS